MRKTVSHDKPKKRAFASHDIAKERVMNVLGPTPPTPPTESQQISPNRAKNGVCVLIIWKNPDSFEIIRKIGYHLESPDSFEIIRKIGNHLEKIRTVLKPSRKLAIIWKIRTVLISSRKLAIIWKKSGQF